jgi:hypothetical protein
MWSANCSIAALWPQSRSRVQCRPAQPGPSRPPDRRETTLVTRLIRGNAIFACTCHPCLAAQTANLTGFHFHDLRHTGNTLAGAAGASLRELMERMGHSTTRAAPIYQHRTSERDKLIADAMGKLAKAELRQRGRPSGTQRGRKGKRAS